MDYVYLENMRGKEVCRIYDYDRETLKRRAWYFYEDYKKSIAKRNQYPYVMTFCYKIPHTMREYIIALAFLSKKESDAAYLPIVREKDGIYIYETLMGYTCVNKYLPHVFDRYVERMKGKIDGIETMNRLSVIKLFVSRNFLRPYKIKDKVRKGNEEYELYINDGCLMMQYDPDNNVILVKTFVSRDMLYEAQKERDNINERMTPQTLLIFETLLNKNLL